MRFSVVKKGYDAKEVDGYVAETEAKLDEYRKMESAISNSIISAEIAKARIINEAEAKAKRILEDANIEVAEQIEAIKKMLECEKKALDNFCSEYDGIIKTYFTAGAAEITAPLKEKLLMIEQILYEPETDNSTEADEAEDSLDAENGDEKDPFGEIKNYF